MSCLFAFSYCSWGSQGKNTDVFCHSLLQWTTFCQTSPPWLISVGWPHRAWLSFIDLDKAVVHVIKLASCLWLWFQSVCSLMSSLSAQGNTNKTTRRYHLTWVRMAIMKMNINSNCCQGYGEKGPFVHCWGVCKLVQPFYKTVWSFLKNLKTELLYGPEFYPWVYIQKNCEH